MPRQAWGKVPEAVVIAGAASEQPGAGAVSMGKGAGLAGAAPSPVRPCALLPQAVCSSSNWITAAQDTGEPFLSSLRSLPALF